MITRWMRRRARRPSGQVLVLACVALFVLSLAVVSTVDAGRRVHERIRLQNAADAAAYSMAAVEARAFNFYAYANRAQASHYVSAMIWQSTISFFYFNEAFLTDAYGVVRTLYPCGEPNGLVWEVICPILENIPKVGKLFKGISQVVEVVRRVVQGLQQFAFRPSETWLDRPVGTLVIPAHRTMNGALRAASRALLLSTLGYVATGAEEVVRINDPSAKPIAPLVTGALTACLLKRAHDDSAWDADTIPADGRLDSDKRVRAKRVMAQVANATRFACEGPGFCPEKFVTSRSLADTMQLPESLDSIAWLLDASVRKWGQTRLLGFEHSGGREENVSNWIHTNNSGVDRSSGPLASGDNLAADDLYQFALGPQGFEFNIGGVGFGGFRNPFHCQSNTDPVECHGDPRNGGGPRGDTGMRTFGRMLKTSVFAANRHEGFREDGGIHWRLAYRRDQNPTRCKSQRCGWTAPAFYTDPISRKLGIALPHDDDELAINKLFLLILQPPLVSGPIGLEVYVANVRGIEDGNHPWEGMVGFPHFEPGQFAHSCAIPGASASESRAATHPDEFNQPSTFAALTRDEATPSVFGGGEVTFPVGGERARLSFEPGDAPTVVSRAQVYYHRPGNWSEHPNFFNPFWRPRLAPVLQGPGVPLVNAVLDVLPEALRSVVTH